MSFFGHKCYMYGLPAFLSKHSAPPVVQLPISSVVEEQPLRYSDTDPYLKMLRMSGIRWASYSSQQIKNSVMFLKNTLRLDSIWLRLWGSAGLFGDVTLNQRFIEECLAQGIKVGGWGWCQGSNIKFDLGTIKQVLETYKITCLVSDIEPGVNGSVWSEDSLKRHCAGVRDLSSIFHAITTFGYIPYHKPELFKSVNSLVDGFDIQTYWFWFPNANMLRGQEAKGYIANDPASYCNLCLDKWREITDKPLNLSGQAYWGEATGWTMEVAESKLSAFFRGFIEWNRIAGLGYWYSGGVGTKAMSKIMEQVIKSAPAFQFEGEKDTESNVDYKQQVDELLDIIDRARIILEDLRAIL